MNGKLKHWILAADLLWSSVAVVLAVLCRYGILAFEQDWTILTQYFLVLGVILLGWTILCSRMELHGFKGGWSFPAITSQVFVGVTSLSVILFAAAFLVRAYYSRLVMTYLTIFLIVGFIVIRCAARAWVLSRSRTGNLRRVVIVGNGRVSRELAAKIQNHPETQLELAGFLYPSISDSPLPPGDVAPERTSVPTLGVLDLLKKENIQELFVVMPQPARAEMEKLIPACRKSGIRVSLVPQWYELYVSQLRLVDLDGLPLLNLGERRQPSSTALKRAIDVAFGALMLLFAAPLLALPAALLRLRKGRAFRKEARCGKDGHVFWMYRLNVDRYSPALVSFERLLDRLSITELPQLWNVIRGDMSLVGPRPESPERVKHYSDWQRQRLSVAPGLTGLAQVHGLREQNSSEEKARFDLQYILHWSPFLDLALLLQTAWTLFVRLLAARGMPPLSGDLQVHPSVLPEVISADRTQSCAD